MTNLPIVNSNNSIKLTNIENLMLALKPSSTESQIKTPSTLLSKKRKSVDSKGVPNKLMSDYFKCKAKEKDYYTFINNIESEVSRQYSSNKYKLNNIQEDNSLDRYFSNRNNNHSQQNGYINDFPLIEDFSRQYEFDSNLPIVTQLNNNTINTIRNGNTPSRTVPKDYSIFLNNREREESSEINSFTSNDNEMVSINRLYREPAFIFDDFTENKFNSFVNNKSITTHIPHNLPKKQVPITKYFKTNQNIKSKWEVLSLYVFCDVLKFLSTKDIMRLELVCKRWRSLSKNLLNSYSIVTVISSSKLSSSHELRVLLNKTQSLDHSKLLSKIIKNDFGDSTKNFLVRSSFYMKLSSLDILNGISTDCQIKEMQNINLYNGHSGNNGILLESFKIKPNNNKDYFISNESVMIICSSSKNTLTELTLQKCIKLSYKIGDSLCSCIYLQRLDISESQGIDDLLIIKICNNLRNLQFLSISSCCLLTDNSLKEMIFLRKLIALDISNCNKMTSHGIFSLKDLPQLEKLIVSGIRIYESDIRVFDYLPNINTLRLDSCSLSNKHIKIISSNTYNRLENLSLNHNNDLSEEVIYTLIKKMPLLKKILIPPLLRSQRIEDYINKIKN